jgi:antitoxin MazE
MRMNIVRIGNSQGLRLPKTLLEACGIRDAVEVSVEEGRLIVSPVRKARAGWAEAAVLMAARGEDALIDPESATSFDEDEWEW